MALDVEPLSLFQKTTNKYTIQIVRMADVQDKYGLTMWVWPMESFYMCFSIKNKSKRKIVA